MLLSKTRPLPGVLTSNVATMGSTVCDPGPASMPTDSWGEALNPIIGVGDVVPASLSGNGGEDTCACVPSTPAPDGGDAEDDDSSVVAVRAASDIGLFEANRSPCRRACHSA